MHTLLYTINQYKQCPGDNVYDKVSTFLRVLLVL